MQKVTFTSILIIFSIFTFAQTPQSFQYQAVARDVSGNMLDEQTVSFRISILQGSATGSVLYTETHPSTTNTFGLVNLEIGKGTVESGVFSEINWGSSSYFLQVEMDDAGGTNYQLMGISQLLSVPYSMHSTTTSDNTRWIRSEIDDLYYLNGKVGIGTETPLYNMEIHSTTTGMARLRISTQDYSKSLFFGSGNTNLGPSIYFEGPDAIRFVHYESGIGYQELIRIQANGDVGIGTSVPEESALLDLNSNNKGFLPPRMSQDELINIQDPTDGLMVFNTTDQHAYIFTSINNAWNRLMYDESLPIPGNCGEVNYGGEFYQTVVIGTQCWLKRNLNIGTRIDGVSDMTDNGALEKYCYDDLESNCDTYGGLYKWDEMMQYTTNQGTQGICPTGWHIATDAEWAILIDYLGGATVAGGKMKETELIHWNFPNSGATNLSGFTGLPGGDHSNIGFSGLGDYGIWWSSTEITSSSASSRYLYYQNSSVTGPVTDKDDAYTVRCIQD